LLDNGHQGLGELCGVSALLAILRLPSPRCSRAHRCARTDRLQRVPPSPRRRGSSRPASPPAGHPTARMPPPMPCRRWRYRVRWRQRRDRRSGPPWQSTSARRPLRRHPCRGGSEGVGHTRSSTTATESAVTAGDLRGSRRAGTRRGAARPHQRLDRLTERCRAAPRPSPRYRRP
jgi:hypothetical protein